jgi:hypothetical protein
LRDFKRVWDHAEREGGASYTEESAEFRADADDYWQEERSAEQAERDADEK